MSASYAIIASGGKQYRVEEGEEIVVDRLYQAAGEMISFKPLLIARSDQTLSVGSPLIKEASVTAKIIDHPLGKKIYASTYKAKTGYRRKKGFRAKFTRLKIEKIKL